MNQQVTDELKNLEEKRIEKIKVDAFRLLYGAATLPFGSVLGALLAQISAAPINPDSGGLLIGRSPMLFISLLAFFTFFAVVPLICESIIRKRLSPYKWAVAAVVVVLAAVAYILPSEEYGIHRQLWLPVIFAWLTVCMVFCALCRSANVEKSVIR